MSQRSTGLCTLCTRPNAFPVTCTVLHKIGDEYFYWNYFNFGIVNIVFSMLVAILLTWSKEAGSKGQVIPKYDWKYFKNF